MSNFLQGSSQEEDYGFDLFTIDDSNIYELLFQESPMAHQPSMENASPQPFFQENIIAETQMNHNTPEFIDSAVSVEHEKLPIAAQNGESSSGEKANKSNKSNEKNNKERHLQTGNCVVTLQNVDQECSSSKKLDHNAKERIRRMRLNASYLALRALLPDSRRSKKRWSAPTLVDKVLKYIPEIENEIQKLKQKKEEIQSAKEDQQQILTQSITVSVNEVKGTEAIFQICMPKNQNGVFSNLLQELEDQKGIQINTASSLSVCDDRICHHIHIEVDEHLFEGSSFEELKHKVVSWLS